MIYDDFLTLNIRKLVAGGKEPIDVWYNGFYSSYDKVVLFEPELIEKYGSSHECLMYLVSQEKLNTLDNLNIHYKKNGKRTAQVYKVDEEFFDTRGKKFRNVRNGLNKYSNLVSFRDEPNSMQDVYGLIKTWNKQRREYLYRLFSGADVNFLENHYQPEQFENAFFYIDDMLVGFSVYEKIRDGYYNSLIRKNDISFSRLSEFIDYMSLKRLYLKTGEYFINIGDDGGRKKLREFKSGHFRVYEEFVIHTVKINGACHGKVGNERAIEKYQNYYSKKTEDYQKTGWRSKNEMLLGFRKSEEYVDFNNVDHWLDIGCGTGNYFDYILQKYDNIRLCYGIDAVDEYVQATKSKLQKYPTVNGKVAAKNLYGLSPDDIDTFNLVTLSGVLQVLDYDKLDLTFDIITSLVKPGGQIWINTLSIDYYKKRRTYGVWTFSQEELVLQLQRKGFVDISCNVYNSKLKNSKPGTAPNLFVHGRKV